MEEEESEVIDKGPCDDCGSSDACAEYSDGHKYCFSCEEYTHPPDDGEERTQTKPKEKRMSNLLNTGEVSPIPSRKLDVEVCERYGYEVGKFDGKTCHIAPYYSPSGELVAQKVRLKGKEFPWMGSPKKALPLFGQHIARSGGKMIVITEGELDAMAVTQAMGLRFPAVSVRDGAGNAKKNVSAALKFLESFEKVVFLFDQDEHGREATEECAAMLTPGKAFVGSLPLKDASDMVKAGKSADLIDAVWGAKPWAPDVLNNLDEIIDEACEEQAWGLPWPWITMTEKTYGIQRSALYTWGAGTGSGKSTLMKQLALTAMRPDLGEDHSHFMPMPEPRPVATLFYEEPAKRTLKTLGGMALGKRVHVPGVEYDQAELKAEIQTFSPLLKSISLKGARNWDTVQATVRFLTIAEGVKDFIIDPMTALTANSEDERRTLDGMMSELADLAEDLDITIHLVFHLATPEGKSHEDGGRIQEKHFRGSRAIAFWSHFLMGLERDKQDPECPTIIRGLKDRPTGDAVGPFIALTYDRETGRMLEVPMPDGNGSFKDETDDQL